MTKKKIKIFLKKSKEESGTKEKKEQVKHSSSGVFSSLTDNIVVEEKAKEKNDVVNIVDRESAYFLDIKERDSFSSLLRKSAIKTFEDIYNNERLFNAINNSNVSGLSYRSVSKIIEAMVDKNAPKSIQGNDRDFFIICASLFVVNKILENVTIPEKYSNEISISANTENIVNGSVFAKFIMDVSGCFIDKYRSSLRNEDTFFIISEQIKRLFHNIGNLCVEISNNFSFLLKYGENNYEHIVRAQSFHNSLMFKYFSKNNKIFSKIDIDPLFVGMYEFMVSESTRASNKIVNFTNLEIDNFERTIKKSYDFPDMDAVFYDMYKCFRYSFGGVLGCEIGHIDKDSLMKRTSELLLYYANEYGIDKLQYDILRIFSFFAFESDRLRMDLEGSKDFIFTNKINEWSKQIYSIVTKGVNPSFSLSEMDPFFSFFSVFGTHGNEEIRKFSLVQMLSSGYFDSLVSSMSALCLSLEETNHNTYYDFYSENPFSFVLKNEQMIDVLMKTINAIYQDVQEFFNVNGKEIGVIEKEGKKLIKLYRPVNSMFSVKPNFISWTYDKDIAKRMGKDVIECDVPVDKIILSSFVYPSMWKRDEKEQYVFSNKNGTEFPWNSCRIIH